MNHILALIVGYFAVGIAVGALIASKDPSKKSLSIVILWPFFAFGISLAGVLWLYIRLVGKEQTIELVEVLSPKSK